MDLGSCRMTPDNIRRCLPFWGGGDGFEASELERAVLRAAALLRRGSARGFLVTRTDGRPVAYGLTVFVHESFADSYLSDPHPLIGRRLLLRDPEAILDGDVAVGRRNAGAGLQMLVASQGASDACLRAGGMDAVVREMVAQFLELHRGYRLARIINEVIGPAGVDDVGASAVFASYHRMEYVTRTGCLAPSLLAVSDRDQAIARRSLLMPMFSYTPPRLLFTPAERALLQLALEGGTDTELATSIGIPPSSVKARWKRIQQRVSDRMPDLLPARTRDCAPARGVQVRHLILRYLRGHPEELTPYAAQSSGTPRPGGVARST